VNSASGFRYIPALDGMRALAVLAVVLYHADVACLPSKAGM
jgi:peptidoglycan/LPS O-acetylase OafA/YrhL